ncbi:hypothetical protein [Bradyrhizobium diazoefficiens]|uniref:hypothetical protein n=2 Tax=Bradyrhizobium diazoefficiens TaxID=1355477 RepID=UPI0027146211|nr:hypothetical protein [Bradyrhizobium diazoefficiens]WLA54973.1 hypothetical protein QIH81_31215 [Bradyrhizobium diazoefficiens]
MSTPDSVPQSADDVTQSDDDVAGQTNLAGAQLTLITKMDEPSLMSKRLSLNDDGSLNSDGSKCWMSKGMATRAFAATAAMLARIIVACRPNQAIALGSLAKNIADPVHIVTKDRVNESPGCIARTRDFIDYRSGVPSWLLIDFDTKGMPPEVKAKIDSSGGMWSSLLTVAPDLARAARVSRASTSAGLSRADTGDLIPGSDGEHHYLLVADGGDIERFLRDLHDKCWLNGFGWHMISRAGTLLERSIVDRMVGFGERLCFEGAPLIVPPLVQNPSKREPRVFDGQAIDSSRVVPAPTEYDRHRIDLAKADSKRALSKAAAEIANKHDQDLAKAVSARSGTPIATALRLIKARHQGVLYPDIELEFDRLGSVTVGAVLATPERYVNETLADPLEGVSYGRCKAMVLGGGDGDLVIHSFAHGRSFYYLRYDLASAKAIVTAGPAAGMVDHAMAILAQASLELDELDDFAASVAKAAGASVRTIKARMKSELAERKSRARESFFAKATTDARIVRPLPYANEELLPTVTLIDDVLAKDDSPEPPMRNANGVPVRIDEKEPWALHLLTSGSANATARPDELMKAPTQPVITELTASSLQMLIEKYLRWEKVCKDGPIYFAATPLPFIKAFFDYADSEMPVVRGINQAPLVTATGRVIDGNGLDRALGVVHRIDPALRACLPAGKPTDNEARVALEFLMREWLVDVALDDAGKCVVIVLAITLLQRALLPERPAFFVTAGQRGGGKTTLIQMIVAAILGRPAAAAAWSDNAEERKKALFSYLRQAVGVLIWDNISRGSTISCPHIEAALTAPEISDRVLGVSMFETVPASTIQVFTGNSIAPRGDMASRSFILSLNVDRPDPENRVFMHSDPVGWTQANRARLLRALYLILVAGIQNRPSEQQAKTRFKSWWNLAGWPVEYAAALVGIDFDCGKLLLAGEAQDEEASTTSRVLTALWMRFGEEQFTARSVASLFSDYNLATDEDAAELADGLAELAQKAVDKATAQGIGKLFQKHLTGRPTWIEGRVAFLRRVPGHQQNLYRIEIRRAADDRPSPAVSGDRDDDPFSSSN